jgi:uncharacterized delta-60 repeat protein
MNASDQQTPLAAGDMDPTFGDAGIANLRFRNGVIMQAARGIALDPDGKIYVAGGTTHGECALARLNPDGSPDETFASVGVARAKYQNFDSNGTGIQIASDGRLILTTTVQFPALPWLEAAIVCFSSSGQLDTSFGFEGWAFLSTGTVAPSSSAQTIRKDSGETAVDAPTQADGKILSVGIKEDIGYIFRHNPDGSPDTGFSYDGFVRVTLGPGWCRLNAVTDQAGKALAVGYYAHRQGGTDMRPILVRFDVDGSPDETFGSFGSGGAELIEPYHALFNSLLLTDSGKIIGLGATDPDAGLQAGYLIGRTEDGFADTSFNAGEPVFTNVRDQSCVWYDGTLVQGSQKFAVAGRVGVQRGSAFVGRFEADGSPDVSFGNGTGLVEFDLNSDTLASGIVAQGDQKLLVCGQTTIASESRGYVARLEG